jgi:epoxyqueuosine reductase
MISNAKIQSLAKQEGFDLCGVTTNFEPEHKGYFLDWLKDEKFGEMKWLSQNTDKRLAPEQILPGTKSVIVVAVSYAHDPDEKEYQLARYAHGEDYHRWMKVKLERFAEKVNETHGKESVLWRSFVDTGPVLERDLAQKAGLGWVGKNTCLLSEEKGSYLFLGVLFTSLNIEPDQSAFDQCGSCQLCVEACPTDALDPYQLDATKCLAYHNIETRGERDQQFWKSIGDHLIGCDICQDVCPHNHSRQTNNTEWLKSFSDFPLKTLKEFLKMTRGEYQKWVRFSAISRVRYPDFMRNVFLVIANTKRVDLKEDVAHWKENHPGLNLAECDYCLEILL